MQQEDIVSIIKNNNYQYVKFAVTDIDGVLRGKVIHKNKFLDLLNSEVGFCDVVFGWDVNDQCYDNTGFTGWHSGYPDAKARIDVNTFRRVPWDGGVPFFLADFDVGQGLPVCPRTLLKKIDKRCEGMGYKAFFSQEFEWFNFRKNGEGDNAVLGEYSPITKGMFGYSLLRASLNSQYFNDIFSLLEKFGVPLEGLHTETGPGVYEACIHPATLLSAADRAVLFKTGIKEIAYKHGMVASFMAKWNESLPGCGGHMHQSLWNLDMSRNLFYDKEGQRSISKLMESYIAGQLRCLPEILPMYAPTVNSYKRLNTGDWAPSTLAWGIDNRTVPLRVLVGKEKITRLEVRVPGADTNPYLAMAASLASGLYGIQQGLTLDVPPVKGNGYRQEEAESLSRSLDEATAKMKGSYIAKSLFGEGFVDHFVQTREWECRKYAEAVTDWELSRYFEII